MKDPDKVRLPGGDCFLVELRMEMLRNDISFTLLDDLPLDLRDSPEDGPKATSMRYSKCALLV